MIKLFVNDNNILVQAHKLEELVGARGASEVYKTPVNVRDIHNKEDYERMIDNPPLVKFREAMANQWAGLRRTYPLAKFYDVGLFKFKNKKSLKENGQKVNLCAINYDAEDKTFSTNK